VNEKAPWISALEKVRVTITKRTDDPGTRRLRPKEHVVNSKDVRWHPIDRVAMIVTRPALWIHKPPDEKAKKKTPEPAIPTTHEARNEKKKHAHQQDARTQEQKMRGQELHKLPGNIQQNRKSEWQTENGIQIKVVNGEEMINISSVYAYLCREVPKLVGELNPSVEAAKAARAIMDELLHGIGGEMEKFKQGTKQFLEDIRGTRFAVVAETSQMTTALKDVRQFFLGADYTEQIARLKEFVELCDRLNTLKDSGFLDKIADTLLTLSVTK